MDELKRIYDEDQGDRRERLYEKDRTLFAKRDRERLERVLALIREQRIVSAADHLHAAMILQHGAKTEHYRMAHELAKQAADMGYVPLPDEVDPLWLAAAAEDRALMSDGKPQRYGTQFKKDSADGPWYLYPVDPSVTDEERARFHVRTLEEAKRRVEELNKGK